VSGAEVEHATRNVGRQGMRHAPRPLDVTVAGERPPLGRRRPWGLKTFRDQVQAIGTGGEETRCCAPGGFASVIGFRNHRAILAERRSATQQFELSTQSGRLRVVVPALEQPVADTRRRTLSTAIGAVLIAVAVVSLGCFALLAAVHVDDRYGIGGSSGAWMG